MRWPLSLLFRGDRDTAPAADGGAPGAAGEPEAAPSTGTGATSEPGSGADAPVRPTAWSGLAPIQRTVGEAPLTAPAVAFGRDLAGLRRPDPIIRPLGHDVAADGPAGLVSGIATPLVAASAPISAMVGQAGLPPLPASSAPRGVQRRARTVSAAGTVPSAGAISGAGPAREPGGDGPSEGAVPPAAPAAAAAADAETVPLPVPPPRVLPVVAPSAVAPALAATRVASATAPEPPLVLAPPVGTGTPAGATTPSGIGGSVERSGPASISPQAAPRASAIPGPAATRAIVSAPEGQDTGAVPPSAHHSLGASRRLGLGAPLAGRPLVQRSAAGPDPQLARAGHASVPPAPGPVGASPVRRAAASPAALPVLRTVMDARRPPAPAGPDDARSGDRALDAPPVPSLDPADPDRAQAAVLPLAGRSPGRALVGDPGRWATSPIPDGVDVGAGSDPVGPAIETPGGLPLPEGTLPPSPASPGARPQAHAAPAPPAPSSWSAAALVPIAAPGQATSAVRSAPLVVARSLRGAEPLRSGAGPAVAPAGAAARIVGTPAPVAHGATATGPASHGAPGSPLAAGRGSGMSVARAAAVPGLPVHAVGAAEEPVPVSRLTDTGGSAAPTPGALGWTAAGGFAPLPVDGLAVVQRAVAIDEMTTDVTTGAGAGAGAGSAGAAGPAGAGQDYEEIADHVYDRIRSRFATELLLDRERMGLLIDG